MSEDTFECELCRQVHYRDEEVSCVRCGRDKLCPDCETHHECEEE